MNSLNRLALCLAVATTVVFIGSSRAHVQQAADTPAWKAALARVPQRDGQHDFDWIHGTWKVHLKRLQRPLTGSTTWVEYEGTSTAREVWGGRANLDEFNATAPDGTPLQGLTLRLYNPETRLWSLYWANAKNGAIGLPPTVGRFVNGRGEFYDEEDYEGRRIVVRYIWSDITANSAHFEQAFSTDGGKTWEPNWISTITRLEK